MTILQYKTRSTTLSHYLRNVHRESNVTLERGDLFQCRKASCTIMKVVLETHVAKVLYLYATQLDHSVNLVSTTRSALIISSNECGALAVGPCF